MGTCYTKRRRIQTTREHLDFFFQSWLMYHYFTYISDLTFFHRHQGSSILCAPDEMLSEIIMFCRSSHTGLVPEMCS